MCVFNVVVVVVIGVIVIILLLLFILCHLDMELDLLKEVTV